MSQKSSIPQAAYSVSQVLTSESVESRYRVGWSQRALGGMIFWARNIIEAGAHFQSLNALGESGLLIGRNNLIRVASPHMVDAIELDDWSKASRLLPSIAENLFQRFGADIARTFLTGTADCYKPCISDQDLNHIRITRTI